MPELPEVEIISRGVRPFIVGKKVLRTLLRSTRLRWTPSVEELSQLKGQQVLGVERRGKYLIVRFSRNGLVFHMGMTGTLRCLSSVQPPAKHDHFDMLFDDGSCLRFRDPRKFGGMVLFRGDPHDNLFFAGIGPEPFTAQMDGSYLYSASRGKRVAVKNFIMDQRVLAGVGNIYANEALFLSGIHPTRAAGRVAEKRYEVLAANIRRVLNRAIEAGGTSFRDFHDQEGRPGYFTVQLNVYGKEGRACPRCGQRISVMKVGQRSTFYCPKCQR